MQLTQLQTSVGEVGCDCGSGTEDSVWSAQQGVLVRNIIIGS
jgi:hypothetical protein